MHVSSLLYRLPFMAMLLTNCCLVMQDLLDVKASVKGLHAHALHPHGSALKQICRSALSSTHLVDNLIFGSAEEQQRLAMHHASHIASWELSLKAHNASSQSISGSKA